MPETRWVRKNRQIIGNCCAICGLQSDWFSPSYNRCSQARTCLACGTRQCLNSENEWDCKVCEIGLLPMGSHAYCDREGCGGPAVANWPGHSGYGGAHLCRDHLAPAGLTDQIAKALAERNLYWEEIEE